MTQNTVTIFSSAGCGPCKMLKAKLVDPKTGEKRVSWDFTVKNIDGNEDLAMKYGFREVPATVITNDEGLVHTIVGCGANYITDVERWL